MILWAPKLNEELIFRFRVRATLMINEGRP